MMKWFWICAASQATSQVLTPVAPVPSVTPVAPLVQTVRLEHSERGTSRVNLGQQVYTPQCERVTVTSVFDDGTIVVKDSFGVLKSYSQSELGICAGSTEGVSVGDRVYTPHGASSVVKCLFDQGIAYVEESYSGKGVKLAVNRLGVCSGSLEGFRVGEKVYTPAGASSTIKCFYKNQSALVDQCYSGKLEILPAASLGVCSGRMLGLSIGQKIYTPSGVASTVKSFYKNGKVLVVHDYDGHSEILHASVLGLDAGAIGLVAVGDDVYTSSGEKLRVKGLYRNGTALLENTYRGHLKIKSVDSLGVTTCGAFGVSINEEAITPSGRYGKVLAIYPRESVLLQYLDRQDRSFGGIFSIDLLKFKEPKKKKVALNSEVSAYAYPSVTHSPPSTPPVPSAPPAELFEESSLDSASVASRVNVVVLNEGSGEVSALSSAGSSSNTSSSAGTVSQATAAGSGLELTTIEVAHAKSNAPSVGRVGSVGVGEDEVCKVCLDQPMSVILIPCGHYVLCDECSKAIEVCPICRTAVSSKHKVFR